jgi:hypothetical protein
MAALAAAIVGPGKAVMNGTMASWIRLAMKTPESPERMYVKACPLGYAAAVVPKRARVTVKFNPETAEMNATSVQDGAVPKHTPIPAMTLVS